MITPEKLQTPDKPLDSGEASIYVPDSIGFDRAYGFVRLPDHKVELV